MSTFRNDDAGFDIADAKLSTRQRKRSYLRPAAFLVSLIGLLLFSELFGNGRLVGSFHSSTHVEETAARIADQAAVTKGGAIAAYLTAASSAGDPSPHVVLDKQRNTVTSPSTEWRLRLTESGELLLERSIADVYRPIWWSNSAVYETRHPSIDNFFVTLDPAGVLSIRNLSSDAHLDSDSEESSQEIWRSSDLRLCSFSVDADAEHFFNKPRTQSLSIGNDGRLIIWSAKGSPTCILCDPTRPWPSSDFLAGVSLDVEQPVAGASETEWPLYEDSSLYSLKQLRALHQRDVAKLHRSAMLDNTQLHTIYDTAFVIPSFNGHIRQTENFLRSMVRHCVDCDLWQISIIVDSDDWELFADLLLKGGNESLLSWLPGLRLVNFDEMKFEHYSEDVDVATISKNQTKYAIQNFKKQQGCLASKKGKCAVFDAEGMFIRTTWFADIIKEYFDDPFIIHHPESRNGTYGVDEFSDGIAQTYGIDSIESAGWLLSYYTWYFDNKVLSDVVRIFAERYPTAEDAPQYFFNEIAYAVYVWAGIGYVPGPEYRFITARELLGERIYHMSWDREIVRTGELPWLTLIEHVRDWFIPYPYMLIPTAEVWQKNNLHLYNAGKILEHSLAFLNIAKSVHICVSDQQEDLFHIAMMGHFNKY